MRYGILMTVATFGFGSSALAQTQVGFHVKAPTQSCREVIFEYKDTKKAGAKQVREIIANSTGKKDKVLATAACDCRTRPSPNCPDYV